MEFFEQTGIKVLYRKKYQTVHIQQDPRKADRRLAGKYKKIVDGKQKLTGEAISS